MSSPVQRIGTDILDAFLLQEIGKSGETLLLILLQALDLDEQLFKLLFRSAAVGALDRDALANLAGKAGDADHEKLVEVGRRDRQEPHTFEQRMIRVLRFFEDTAVELKPGEFPIDETVRIARHGFSRGLAHKLVPDRPQLSHFRSFVTVV